VAKDTIVDLWADRMQKRVLLAITGASGVRVGFRLAEYLSRRRDTIIFDIVISEGALKVAYLEEGMERESVLETLSRYARVYLEHDFSSPYASSSNAPDVMIIAPASMKTVALIASGIAENLIVRAALSVLRLRRRLVVAPRETPLGIVELENMLKLARAGAIITPLMVAFYHKPENIGDIVDFLVGKLLDAAGIENKLYRRWGETA